MCVDRQRDRQTGRPTDRQESCLPDMADLRTPTAAGTAAASRKVPRESNALVPMLPKVTVWLQATRPMSRKNGTACSTRPSGTE